eukprot:403338035
MQNFNISNLDFGSKSSSNNSNNGNSNFNPFGNHSNLSPPLLSPSPNSNLYLDKRQSITEVSSLYERIGGYEGCLKIVEGMYAKTFNDPDLADFFRKSDKGHQVQKMTLFFVYTTGGKEDWEGKSMKEMHQGKGIGSHQFEKMVGHIRHTMLEIGLMEELIDELIERLDLLKPAYLEEN